jgi:hypothetical protein
VIVGRRLVFLGTPTVAIAAAVVAWIALPASAAPHSSTPTTKPSNQAQALTERAATARHLTAQVKRERTATTRWRERRGCPVDLVEHALRLPPDAVAEAANTARHYGQNDPRTVIVASALATSPASGTRGTEARWQCGSKTASRTVVVELFYPWLLPSASLTQGTLFVSYFQRGYRVWEVAH